MKAAATIPVMREMNLTLTLALRDFRSKYAGSMMGAFWSVVNPLLLLAVFTFVFTIIFKVRFGDAPGLKYSALYIFAGILPWLAFQEPVGRGAFILIEHSNLVTKLNFPSRTLPASLALSAILGELAGLAILLVFSAFNQAPTWTIILLPVILLLQLLITVGVALIVSAVNVFFRDLGQILPVLLMVWMYATPVFYSPEMVPEKYRFIILANPITHVVEAYRAVIIKGVLPSASGMLFLGVSSLIVLGLGIVIFKSGEARFADRL